MNETNMDIDPRAGAKDSGRLRGYRELLDFYRGLQWPGREKWGEKRLTLNYARVFTDKITSYLMSGISFTVEPINNTDQERADAETAEKLLTQVCQDNSLEQLDFETELDCAILGDACYKVTWDAPAKMVRVTAPDVQGISAWWAGDDMSRVWKVTSKYTLSAEEAERLYGSSSQSTVNSSQSTVHSSQSTVNSFQSPPTITKLNTDNGKLKTITEVWTEADFELYLDNMPLEKKPNPYGFIPFVIFPNVREPRQFWGTSDLVQIMEPQRELNRAFSQISHILELSGNPVAVLENVEQSTDIAVRPGAVWNIPEDAKAYLLDLLQGGGLGLHINYIEMLYRALHDVSETPRSAFGGNNLNLSGTAMQIELYPLIQKVLRKRVIRAGVYFRRNQMILKLLEKYRGARIDGCRSQVAWGQVLPQDKTQQITNETALIRSGVHSRRRAMGEVGVKDPEAEFKQWMAEKKLITEAENAAKPADI